MKKLLQAFGLFAALSSAGSLSAASIIYWADYTVGSDAMAGALSDLSATHTITTASSDGDFATQLTGGGFDLAILAHQNYSSSSYVSDEAVAAFIAGGGRAIFQSWYISDSTPLLPYEAAFTGGYNEASVSVSLGAFAAGLSSNPMTLSNPGWGVFSTGLGGSGFEAASFGSGDGAIVVGNGGRTIVNGFLTDTHNDFNDGKQLYKNEIGYLLGASTPDAGSSLLLLAIGSGAIAMFRGQRRKVA
jgi:hypothetical protein